MREFSGKILLIRHGALGDMAKNTPLMQAIANRYPHAELSVLTRNIYADWIRKTLSRNGVAPKIVVDNRAPFRLSKKFFGQARNLKNALDRFDLIFDLQASTRTRLYSKLTAHPVWYRLGKDKTRFHRFIRLGDKSPLPDRIEFTRHDLRNVRAAGTIRKNEAYVVIVLDVSARHPEKSWDLARFIELGRKITHATRKQIRYVAQLKRELPEMPNALNLTGRTDLIELDVLLAGADLVIGADTGPMHMAALSGVKTLTLFSHATDPRKHAPNGPNLNIVIDAPELSDITVERTFAACMKIF